MRAGRAIEEHEWLDEPPAQPATKATALPAGTDASFEENDAVTDTSLCHGSNKLGARLNG